MTRKADEDFNKREKMKDEELKNLVNLRLYFRSTVGVGSS